ncbi:hypothetical protein ONZ51_g13159 [Trametes cubensis]|uniref:Transmembrane protein n=1 Tax=Trametes cubensis TaxID=1111947 RepID=A0AAD7X394_9APHY|nr:hypothetical protein ONZ51_g13159 [Trametes cubensis]
MSGDLNESNAFLVGTWLQLIAMGAYLVYLPQCAVLVMKKFKRDRSFMVPVTCLLFFAAAMTDLVLSLVMAHEAYYIHGSQLPNPDAIYGDPAATLSLIKNAATVFIVILSDSIIIYRAFVLWDRNHFVIIVPTGLFLCDVAFGILTVWTLAKASRGDDIDTVAAGLARTFFIITFVLNLLCSAMICYKLWLVFSLFPVGYVAGPSAAAQLFDVLVQSAALYCATLLLIIVTNCVKSNLFFVFLGPLSSIAAYVFSAILVGGWRQRAWKVPYFDDVVTDDQEAEERKLGPPARYQRRGRLRARCGLGAEMGMHRCLLTSHMNPVELK